MGGRRLRKTNRSSVEHRSEAIVTDTAARTRPRDRSRGRRTRGSSRAREDPRGRRASPRQPLRHPEQPHRRSLPRRRAAHRLRRRTPRRHDRPPPRHDREARTRGRRPSCPPEEMTTGCSCPRSGCSSATGYERGLRQFRLSARLRGDDPGASRRSGPSARRLHHACIARAARGLTVEASAHRRASAGLGPFRVRLTRPVPGLKVRSRVPAALPSPRGPYAILTSGDPAPAHSRPGHRQEASCSSQPPLASYAHSRPGITRRRRTTPSCGLAEV